MKLNINDEQGIELLYFIFERELKPPFRRGGKDDYGNYLYYNRDDGYIGVLDSYMNFYVYLIYHENIRYKVCQAFGFSRSTWDWWSVINPHLKSWIEAKLSIEINTLDATRI